MTEMTERITINAHYPASERVCPVILGNGVLRDAEKYMFPNGKRGRMLVVTDDGVPEQIPMTVCRAFGAELFTLKQGEKSKSLDSFSRLIGKMLGLGFDREDCVCAVGGGVVGDLAGFAAACYLRGIGFYYLPTTLLAQTDASVGGKTAVDFGGFKNQIGAFYQPSAVLIDPTLTASLSDRQFYAGLCEAIKMAVTFDEKLLELIEAQAEKGTLRSDADALFGIVSGAVRIKTAVVEKDEREAGTRRALNFGHTLGHALESASGGELLHGEAVALGMLPFCSEPVRERLRKLLSRCSLPTEIPPELEKRRGEIADALTHDKKRAGEGITAVFCDEAGSFRFEKVTAEEIIEKKLSIL